MIHDWIGQINFKIKYSLKARELARPNSTLNTVDVWRRNKIIKFFILFSIATKLVIQLILNKAIFIKKCLSALVPSQVQNLGKIKFKLNKF